MDKKERINMIERTIKEKVNHIWVKDGQTVNECRFSMESLSDLVNAIEEVIKIDKNEGIYWPTEIIKSEVPGLMDDEIKAILFILEAIKDLSYREQVDVMEYVYKRIGRNISYGSIQGGQANE